MLGEDVEDEGDADGPEDAAVDGDGVEGRVQRAQSVRRQRCKWGQVSVGGPASDPSAQWE